MLLPVVDDEVEEERRLLVLLRARDGGRFGDRLLLLVEIVGGVGTRIGGRNDDLCVFDVDLKNIFLLQQCLDLCLLCCFFTCCYC